MACDVCGAADREIVNNEAWAGSAACNHGACVRCLRQCIVRALPECAAREQVRIPCYAPGCRKALPQQLVLSSSAGARALATLIDGGCPCSEPQHDDEMCPACGERGLLVANEGCGHAACVTCWEGWAERELPRFRAERRLRLTCCHPGCVEPVATDFWRRLGPLRECVQVADQNDTELELIQQCGGIRPGQATEPGPICPICCEPQVALLCDQSHGMCRDLNHGACQGCWTRWAEENLDRCLLERAVALRCLWPQCGQVVGRQLWEHLARTSSRVRDTEGLLARRRQLEANELYPAAMQVNCPQVGCVGLGYLGFDTVMCFMCEHQWVPEEGAGDAPHTDVEHVMGLEVKRCPRCREYIEKNGGCNHMTCRCKHEFYWTTLQAYRSGGA